MVIDNYDDSDDDDDDDDDSDEVIVKPYGIPIGAQRSASNHCG